MLDLLKTDTDLRKKLFENISESPEKATPLRHGVSAADQMNLSKKNVLPRTPLRDPLEEQYLMSKQVKMDIELNDNL
jgi:hypothetical protein